MTVIDLPRREGGFVKAFIDQAERWKAEGVSVRIVGDQYSAAAIQCVYLKKIGVPVTYRPRFWLFAPALYFHASIASGNVTDAVRYYLGANIAALIGPLRADRWTRLSPSRFGIAKH